MKNANAAWQQEYFGRHVQLVPAEFARGYQYQPVIRAIPTEGRVDDSIPAWAGAPQADYWMGEKVTKYKPDWIRFVLRMIRKK